jgi:hypothetical protein
MSLQTIEIEAFSGPTSVLIGGGNQPTIVYINQGPAGTSGTVDQTIIDGSTNAVAGNAVFDALALKAPLASPTFTGIVTAPRITGRCDGLEVFCKAGLAIAAGQVVYVTGASGNNIIIGLARANAEATSSKTIGISESTLANNATGYVITEGLMTVSISAPTAVEGDPIWLSPTTAGSMVFGAANKPFAPNHIVYLGVVTRKTGNTVVEIYVKVQNGAELDGLSDVLITSAVAGQALMRGATLWENRSLVSADISDATSAATANTLVLRDGSGGSNFAAVGATTVTASGAITTTGANAAISTQGSNSYIYTTGADAYIYTTGANAEIVTYGQYAPIATNGANAQIATYGLNAYISTGGTSAYIQSRSTFKLYNGTYTTTLSHSPTDNRAIAFPNDGGTVALINPSSGTQTFTGSQIFSSTTRPTSSGTGTPAATSLITRTDLETQLMSDDFVYVVDDFFGGGGPNVGVPAPGPLPWVLTTLIGTSSFRYGANTALSLPCPGGASIQTGTNNRDCGAVSFAGSYAGGAAITQSDFNSSTILKWRFYVQSAMGLRIGLGANPVAPTFQGTRFIGLTGWLPATVWTASTAVSVGNYYRPTTPNGRRYYASVAGTTAGTEPVWPTGAASTVTDGGVTWTEDGRDGNANFQYCTRDGTALTGTQTNSGIPYAVGWHTFTLRYLGSNNWGMSVDGASEATLNINVATITILMQAQAYTTGQKHLLFDYFKFFQRVR